MGGLDLCSDLEGWQISDRFVPTGRSGIGRHISPSIYLFYSLSYILNTYIWRLGSAAHRSQRFPYSRPMGQTLCPRPPPRIASFP